MENIPSITQKEKDILIKYVVDHSIDKSGIEIVEQLCKKQPKVTMTLYRGHSPNYTNDYEEDNSHKTIMPRKWFSTSSSKEISEDRFTNKTNKKIDRNEKCCLFIIHVEDVPVIDINKYIGDEIGDKSDEDEFIVLGGGTFYQDEKQEEKGFKLLKNKKYEVDTYECWYFIDKKSVSSLDKQKLDNLAKSAIRNYIELHKPIDLDSDSDSDLSVSSRKSLSKKELQEIDNKHAMDWIKKQFFSRMNLSEEEKEYIIEKVGKILNPKSPKKGGNMTRRKRKYRNKKRYQSRRRNPNK
jgi:hypothetical protein